MDRKSTSDVRYHFAINYVPSELKMLLRYQMYVDMSGRVIKDLSAVIPSPR